MRSRAMRQASSLASAVHAPAQSSHVGDPLNAGKTLQAIWVRLNVHHVLQELTLVTGALWLTCQPLKTISHQAPSYVLNFKCSVRAAGYQKKGGFLRFQTNLTAPSAAMRNPLGQNP